MTSTLLAKKVERVRDRIAPETATLAEHVVGQLKIAERLKRGGKSLSPIERRMLAEDSENLFLQLPAQ